MLIPALAAFALSVALFVETSSWWIRVNATKDNFGFYISRSNIYLYGGRFFSLIFGVFLAYQIESGMSPENIALTLCISFAFACCLQLLLLRNYFRKNLILILSICLRLPSSRAHWTMDSNFGLDRPLFFGTLTASLSFALGLSVPPLLAAIFIANRLVISNVGQLINAFGMIVILFFVDQKLYKAFDSGDLYNHLMTYSKARSLAFFLISIMFLVIYLSMSNG